MRYSLLCALIATLSCSTASDADYDRPGLLDDESVGQWALCPPELIAGYFYRTSSFPTEPVLGPIRQMDEVEADTAARIFNHPKSGCNSVRPFASRTSDGLFLWRIPSPAGESQLSMRIVEGVDGFCRVDVARDGEHARLLYVPLQCAIGLFGFPKNRSLAAIVFPGALLAASR